MFHARDGLFFERFDVVLPADTWASVLAACCARGETFDTWNEARQFHNRS